ncbi:A24 family peptidase [Trinickia dinghuensis]|uniref:Prepilin peptidase n=1 Tax=Trinickia dinghuensis TaxID=2291023 RepID=A0A3D8JWC9_9BURK|nr:prepilin peptidase [Trinickia dinghuensis]RDU97367.1 prepilin peptidase [Trinickia dinghuensis]
MPFGSAVFTVWAVLVAWSDCRDRRVANGLVAFGAAAALACAAMHAAPFGVAPMQAAVGALVGFVALLPFFLLGVMGAADVKVFAVLGAWCGVSALLGLWIAATIVSALHAIALLVAARVRSGAGAAGWSPWRNGQPTFAIGARRATPYAALLVGAASLHLLGRSLQGAMH